MKTAYRVTTVLAALCLSACGGGGSSGSNSSGGGGGGGGGASQFSVGGSVSGLTAGSGVVLLDNGGNALTVPADATSFTFSSMVASGASYAVTVQTQPSGETCTIANGSGTASANVTNVGVSCASQFAAGGANVVSLMVAAGPAAASSQTFNIPLVTVTVCEGATCAQIPNVLVDSGSEGLRVMASVLAGAGLTVPGMADPLVPGNTIHECAPFADGYSWGAVGTATVKVGGEATATAIPIQIIDDGSTPNPAVPSSGCVIGNSMNSVNAFDANGVLGVGVFAQDCGPACTTSNNVYWSCTTAGACTATTLVAASQVENPVAAFSTDNNGAIIQLPAVSAAGAATVSGYLVFGIGTESNNSLGGESVLTADSTNGEITTSFEGQTLSSSIIDSGSNALFFPTSAASPITLCSTAASFYCPSANPPTSPLNLTAVNQGQNGATSNVAFQIVDLVDLDSSNFALDDVGGPVVNTPKLSNYFDWGVPFFYGRTVFIGLNGANAGGTTGPYYAY